MVKAKKSRGLIRSSKSRRSWKKKSARPIYNNHYYNTGTQTISAAQVNINSANPKTTSENSTYDIGKGVTSPQNATPSTSSGKRNPLRPKNAVAQARTGGKTAVGSSIKDASLREYAKQGTITTAFLKKYGDNTLVGALARAEEDVGQGHINNDVEVLLNDFQELLNTSSLAADRFIQTAEFCENNKHLRAVLCYYCASFLPNARANQCISNCILGASKALKHIIKDAKEGKKIAEKIGLPLITSMLDKLREVKGEEESGVKNLAFALNWVAFTCIDVKKYDDAVNYTEEGVTVMDENFGKWGPTKMQTYTRLLLNLGVAHYHLGNAHEAAINLKRAAANVEKVEDFKRGEKTRLKRLIKYHRGLNNKLCAASK